MIDLEATINEDVTIPISIPLSYESLLLRKENFIPMSYVDSEGNGYGYLFWNKPIIFRGLNVIQPSQLYENSQSYYIGENYEEISPESIAEYRYVVYVFPAIEANYLASKRGLTTEQLKNLLGVTENVNTFITFTNNDQLPNYIEAVNNMIGATGNKQEGNVRCFSYGMNNQNIFNITDSNLGKNNNTTELFKNLVPYENIENYNQFYGVIDIDGNRYFAQPDLVRDTVDTSKYNIGSYISNVPFMWQYPTQTNKKYICNKPFTEYFDFYPSTNGSFTRGGTYIFIGVEKIGS